jgi:alkylhydroperoxidase family enzyme
MADEGFSGRNRMEFFEWPAMTQAFMALQQVALGAGEIPQILKLELFTLASLASGCRHCQAHGSVGQSMFGSDLKRIQELWTFQTSALFTDEEKAAYEFALAAGMCPPDVTPKHHADLRKYYNDQQIREIVGVIAISGFLNRYSNAVMVVTDQGSVDWATQNLSELGWTPGNHVGSPDEQRSNLPQRR